MDVGRCIWLVTTDRKTCTCRYDRLEQLPASIVRCNVLLGTMQLRPDRDDTSSVSSLDAMHRKHHYVLKEPLTTTLVKGLSRFGA
jgi:hypothetical protein